MDRKYCGKRVPIPAGYTREGTKYECLQTGFGVATALCRQRAYRAIVPLIFVIVFITVATVLLLLMIVDIFRRRTSSVVPIKKGNMNDVDNADNAEKIQKID